MTIDIIVIGGITWDLNIVEKGKWEGFGGGVTYSSYILSKLGVNVGLVSYISSELHESYMRLVGKNIDFSGLKVKEGAIIRFTNRYKVRERFQEAYPPNYRISIKDIPKKYLDAKYAIITSVLGEVSKKLPIYLGKMGIKVFLDLQGYTRRTYDGIVIYKSPGWLPYSFIDIIKGDSMEVKETLSKIKKLKSKPRFIIVTLGDKGSYIYDRIKWKKYYFPAVKVKAIDTTGAGDVYLAILTYAIYKGKDIIEAGKLATAYAAYSTQFKGPKYPVKKGIIDDLASEVEYLIEDISL